MSLAWWQRGVVYQVYPRSFADSDGDGVGDLRGITERLGHLAWLGVDAVWISPIFPSPMTDFGYDVADYCGIDPLFGTLADFDALLARAHVLGLKVILDFVPNHSSDRHPWFEASRRRADGKADFYLWRDAAPDGGPPNNWLAHFNGAAWTFDELRGQYFLHLFLPTQPDLNWRNPEVRAALFEVMRFWLRRGVDGFRVDVLWMMIKDDQYRDNPPNPDWRPGMTPHDRLLPLYTADRPEVHEVVRAMRGVSDGFPERVLIGEIYLPIDRLVDYYGTRADEAHLPFNFHLLLLPEWSATAVAELIRRYEAALPEGAWPNWVLGNHDRPRVASRVGPAQARVAAMLLLTLRGTPTLYMGDELGMVDTPIPPEAIRDPGEFRQPGLGLGRDPVRTPFPWTDEPGAGFTTGAPWLPIGADVPLSLQYGDPDSMVSLQRQLLALRRARASLSEGAISSVRANGGALSYERHLGDDRLAVVLNLAHDPVEISAVPGVVVAATHQDRLGAAVGARLTLRPDEGLVTDPSSA